VSEPKPKPFAISKRAVWQAWLRVKANKGAAGVDEQSILEFERDLKGNLYKLWNRLSSGSYFPPPVRAVEIPKRDGSSRTLGVPTVADRIAQTVVAAYLEPEVEPIFHPDSYGYRPGRSALDAVGVCRERCWRNDWVLDLDLKSFFDSVPWDLVLKAVARHTDQRWVLLYVERWLKAPLQREDGSLVERDRGTPQGVCDLAPDGQRLPALCVRFVDGPELPGRPLRALLRRRDCPRPQRASGPAVEGRNRGAAGGVRARAQRAQDPHRLLQGLDATRLLRARVVRFLGVSVPPAAVAEQVWRPVRQLPPRSRRQRAQAHRTGDPPLAAASLVGQDPHGPRAID
jgi:hypothetical protein